MPEMHDRPKCRILGGWVKAGKDNRGGGSEPYIITIKESRCKEKG